VWPSLPPTMRQGRCGGACRVGGTYPGRLMPADPPSRPGRTSVAIITLGCARNEVDSDEIAARLADGGMTLVDDPAEAAAVLVNTCGFVEQAKRESIDVLLDAADSPASLVAVGCLAERYGRDLAAELPEVDAVLGFDDYPVIADRVRQVLAGEHLIAHRPRDRRRLLPVSPVDRAAPHPASTHPPDLPDGLAPVSGPRVVRRRLGSGPVAPVKLASGCDRRCSFCAIPSFRGAFTSRRPEEVLAEVCWLSGQGVREVLLVSENTTSYGKDLGDLRLLESLLPELAALPGIDRVRLSYLQPAEMRPSLVRVIAETPGVAPYFDLSFQHASATLLRRMRRFGSGAEFLRLLADIRSLAPQAGVRSNVIVGFPGETEDDVRDLESFLTEADLDAVGVFGYSSEDGTQAAAFPDAIDPDTVTARVERLAALVDELVSQRAAARVGERAEVLVTAVEPDEATGETRVVGLAAHQGPEVDGITVLVDADRDDLTVGRIVVADVIGSDGVDVIARARITP